MLHAKWFHRLERKFGRFAIRNLILYLTLAMGSVSIFDFLITKDYPKFSLIPYLTFVPKLIFQGEVWRLVSYIIIPPDTSIIFLFFVLYLFYIVGNSLDDHWGSFQLNIYYLIGMIGTTISALITGSATSAFLDLSLFLAFAVIFPNFEILIFFLIPVKVKYLAYITAVYFVLAVSFFPVKDKIACLASILNFLLFFGPDFLKNMKNRQKYKSVQRNFRKEMRDSKRY